MENASKALLLGGGILIGLIVMSIGVYLFASYSGNATSYDQSRQATETRKFNVNFTKFEGRTDITIQEIVTLAKFAKQYEEENDIHIKITIEGKGDINKPENSEEYFIDLIKNNSTKENGTAINYGVMQIVYDNGRVKTISFYKYN